MPPDDILPDLLDKAEQQLRMLPCIGSHAAEHKLKCDTTMRLLSERTVTIHGERGVDAPDALPFAGAKLVCISEQKRMVLDHVPDCERAAQVDICQLIIKRSDHLTS
jgi:hypothetical protein